MKKTIITILITILLFTIVACDDEFDTNTLKGVNPMNDVYYEIFVRSFADSDSDGIGDLKGITQNLDYLNDLGISAIWLMPINTSDSYHGYRVLDYLEINPDYGTMDDFKELITEAKKLDIKIMIDFVINHVSDNHPWYKDAISNQSSVYRDYFVWQGNSAYQSFVGGMVDLNLSNPQLVNEIYDIVDFYLDLGVQGFRLDAAKHFFDKPGVIASNVEIYNIEFLYLFNQHVKSVNSDAFVVAEIFDYDYNFTYNYYQGVDSIFNFSAQTLIENRVGKGSSSSTFSNLMKNIYNKYRTINPNFIDSPFLSNHDIDRIASTSGYLYLNGKEKLALSARVLLTLPGSPFIYYGDELGMKGTRYEGADFGQGPVYDEYRRQPFVWGDSSYQTTWLTTDGSNDNTPTAISQMDDNTSLFNAYKEMINVRKNTPALMYGNSFTPWEDNNANLQGYYREYTYENYSQKVLVIHNLSDSPININVPYNKIIYGSTSITAFGTVILEVN